MSKSSPPVLSKAEFKTLPFADIEWSGNHDAYARKLLRLAEELAGLIEPGFTVSSGGEGDKIAWRNEENCIGYFEYYTSVKKASFKGAGRNRITIKVEMGHRYESDGVDDVWVEVLGLPSGQELFLQTHLAGTADVYVTVFPKPLGEIEKAIAVRMSQGK